MGRRLLVLHVALPPGQGEHSGLDGGQTLAGFVVPRSIGGAVVRNRVKRRLRALLADRLPQVPPGSRVVARALPPSATASFHDLAADLDTALRSALRPRRTRR